MKFVKTALKTLFGGQTQDVAHANDGGISVKLNQDVLLMPAIDHSIRRLPKHQPNFGLPEGFGVHAHDRELSQARAQDLARDFSKMQEAVGYWTQETKDFVRFAFSRAGLPTPTWLQAEGLAPKTPNERADRADYWSR